MSVDYYTRLEQGRDVRPSRAILQALARALCLDAGEEEHLYALAQTEPRAGRASRPDAEFARPALARLVDALAAVPATVLGRRMDVLAWNPMAAALLLDFNAVPVRERNMLRFTFTNPAARKLFPEWDTVAAEAVAHLRVASGRYPRDRALAELVRELSAANASFAQLWARHDVAEKGFGRKRLRHEQVGELVLDYESLAVPGSHGHYLITYVAADPSSQAALDLLSVIGTQQFPAVRDPGVTAQPAEPPAIS